MSYQETAVEIERKIEHFKKVRVITRFVILSILFHCIIIFCILMPKKTL